MLKKKKIPLDFGGLSSILPRLCRHTVIEKIFLHFASILEVTASAERKVHFGHLHAKVLCT